MAVDGFRSLDWLAHNAARPYPLTATATGVSVDDLYRLDNTHLLSLYVHLPWDRDVDLSQFFISGVTHLADRIDYTVSYQPPTGVALVVASFTAANVSNDWPVIAPLTPSSGWPDVAGTAVVGELPNDSERNPLGAYAFTLQAARLEPDCIRPSARSVAGIRVVSGDQQSPVLTGLVELIARENIKLRVQAVEGGNRVTIDAVEAAALSEDCECLEVSGRPILTINRIRPDVSGNIDIVGKRCIQIEPGEAQLQLTNPCSEPCCGCDEAEQLTRALASLTSRTQTLEAVLTALNNTSQAVDRLAATNNIPSNCPTTGADHVFELEPGSP